MGNEIVFLVICVVIVVIIYLTFPTRNYGSRDDSRDDYRVDYNNAKLMSKFDERFVKVIRELNRLRIVNRELIIIIRDREKMKQLLPDDAEELENRAYKQEEEE